MRFNYDLNLSKTDSSKIFINLNYEEVFEDN